MKVNNIENKEENYKVVNSQQNQNNNTINLEKAKDNKVKVKIKYPKRKYAIIYGYFGHNFYGNFKLVIITNVKIK